MAKKDQPILHKRIQRIFCPDKPKKSAPIIVDASGTTCPSRVSVLPVVEWYFDPLPDERPVKGTSLPHRYFHTCLFQSPLE
jgi:hypothetical protein